MSGILQRLLKLSPLCAGIVFCLLGVSALLYPGGTVWDAETRHYDLVSNYLCDLLDPVAHCGVSNPLGSIIGISAFALAAVGLLLPVWLGAPHLARAATWPRVTRALGVFALVNVLLLPVAGLTELRLAHDLAVFAAAIPGFGAAILLGFFLWKGKLAPRWLTSIGAAAAAVGVIDTGLYAIRLAGVQQFSIAGPALQKVALVLVLVWFPGVAGLMLRRAATNRVSP